MATDWDAEREGIYKDLKEEGHPARVIKPGKKGVYDPLLDDFVGGQPDTIFDTYGLQKSLKLGYVTSLLGFTGGGSGTTSYQIGDTIFFIPALGLPDDFDDRFRVEYDGKVKDVVSVVNYSPGGVPLVFEVLLREPKNSDI